MFLIQFIDDGVYQIVDDICNRNGQYCKALWIDKRKYSAKILACHDDFKLLNDIRLKLEQNIPRVQLSSKKEEEKPHNVENRRASRLTRNVAGSRKDKMREMSASVHRTCTERFKKKTAARNEKDSLHISITDVNTSSLKIENTCEILVTKLPVQQIGKNTTKSMNYKGTTVDEHNSEGISYEASCAVEESPNEKMRLNVGTAIAIDPDATPDYSQGANNNEMETVEGLSNIVQHSKLEVQGNTIQDSDNIMKNSSSIHAETTDISLRETMIEINKKSEVTDENGNHPLETINDNINLKTPDITTNIQSGEIRRCGEKKSFNIHGVTEHHVELKYNLSVEEDEFFTSLNLRKYSPVHSVEMNVVENNKSIQQETRGRVHVREPHLGENKNLQCYITELKNFENGSLEDYHNDQTAINIITDSINERNNGTKKFNATEVMINNSNLAEMETISGDNGEQNHDLNDNVHVERHSEEKLIEYNQSDSLKEKQDGIRLTGIVSSINVNPHISERYNADQDERADAESLSTYSTLNETISARNIDETIGTQQGRDAQERGATFELQNSVSSNKMMDDNDCESVSKIVEQTDRVFDKRLQESESLQGNGNDPMTHTQIDGHIYEKILIVTPQTFSTNNMDQNSPLTQLTKREKGTDSLDNISVTMTQFTSTEMNSFVKSNIVNEETRQDNATEQENISDECLEEKPENKNVDDNFFEEVLHGNDGNYSNNKASHGEIMPHNNIEIQQPTDNANVASGSEEEALQQNPAAERIKIVNIEKISPTSTLFNQIEKMIQIKKTKCGENIESRSSPQQLRHSEQISKGTTGCQFKNEVLHLNEDGVLILSYDPENENYMGGEIDPSVLVEIGINNTSNIDSEYTNLERSVDGYCSKFTSDTIGESGEEGESQSLTTGGSGPFRLDIEEEAPNTSMKMADEIDCHIHHNIPEFQLTDDEVKYLTKIEVDCDLYATDVNLNDSLLKKLQEEDGLERVREGSFNVDMDLSLTDFRRKTDEFNISLLDKTVNSSGTSHDLSQDLSSLADAHKEFQKYYERNDAEDDDVSLYAPSDISEDQDDVDDGSKHDFDTAEDSKAGNVSHDSSCLNLSTINDGGYTAPSSKHMFVRSVNDQKVYFCAFCNKLIKSKYARHLETHKKDQKEVQEFLKYPPKHPERRRLIDKLRKNHSAIFNRDGNLNDGELLVCRRPNRNCKTTKSAESYAQCINCNGSIAKSNMRHHFASCTGGKYKGKGTSLPMSRLVMGRIHPRASKILREEIFPDLRDDNVVEEIRYDEIVVLYFNHLAEKYPSSEDHPMLRQKLRILGRFMIALKEENSEIDCYLSLFIPKHHETCIAAVRTVARYDEDSREFEAPTTAITIGTMLKQIGKFVQNLYIVREDPQNQKRATDFVQLITEKFELINRIAAETLAKRKRLKKIILPSVEDIEKLMEYLETERRSSLSKLEIEYSYEAWLTLCETNLLSVMIFNRRRQGESSKMKIWDYNSCEGINEEVSKDLFKVLSPKCKEIAASYKRFEIRGKLGNAVPILLSREIEESIEKMLSFRDAAEVDRRNPYLFGLPSLSKRKTKRLVASALMQKYAEVCGAAIPTTLRGTLLRKHVATMCAHLHLSDPEITNLTKFLGHAQKIHFSHYRQRGDIEILKVSQILEKASGKRSNTVQDGEDEEDGKSSDTFEEKSSEFTKKNNTVAFEDNVDSDDPKCSHNKRKYSLLKETSSIDSEEEYHSKRKQQRKDIGDGDDESDESDQNLQKKNFGSKGKTKVAWKAAEKELIVVNFTQHFENLTLPSKTDIEKLREKHIEILGHRSWQKIKSWISNQHKCKPK